MSVSLQNSFDNIYQVTKAISVMANNHDLITPPYPKEFISGTHIDLIHESVKLFENSGLISLAKDDDIKKRFEEDKDFSRSCNMHLSKIYQVKSSIETSVKSLQVKQVVDIGCAFNLSFSLIDIAIAHPSVQFYIMDAHEIAEIHKQAVRNKFPEGISNLKVISGDLEQDDFRYILEAHGFMQNKKTAFSMHEVLSKLREKNIADILKFIGSESTPGSLVYFSVINKSASGHKNPLSEENVKALCEAGKIASIGISYDKLCEKVYGKIGHSKAQKPKDKIGGMYFEGVCKGVKKENPLKFPNSVLKRSANTNVMKGPFSISGRGR